MTVRGVRVTRRTPKTFRPELALCSGPATLAQTGGGTLAELYGSSWAVGLFLDGPQLLQLSGGVWTERSDPAALATLVDVRHIALSFDQAARPVLAWEMAGAVYVRQWSPQLAQYVTRGPWAGRDPVLICDALLISEPGASDVHLYYLDDLTLVARIQRDLYAVARPVGSVPAGAVLDQAAVSGVALVLFGEAGGARLSLVTDPYPLTVRSWAHTEATGPALGAYLRAVVDVPAADAQHAAATGPAAGEYRPGGELRPAVDTAHAAATGPAAGVYFPLVLLRDAADAQHAAATGPAAGVYVAAVILLNTSNLLTTAATGPTGGTYATP